MRNSKSGFAAVELIIIIVVIAAIAVTGFFVWRNHKSTSTASLNYQSPPVTTPAAPQVTTASDLNSAMQALNQTSVTASNVDSSQLSTQASGF